MPAAVSPIIYLSAPKGKYFNIFICRLSPFIKIHILD